MLQVPNIDELNHRDFIIVKNARQNNLKGLSVAIPQGKLVVITGVSGSGKSSLAFDTLYAEGQRRYVESLSAYIRQFMGKINKPAVDYIKGLSPAVAIQQKVNTSNPRSTVGTTTEIYDYLKLLFARVGRTYSPISGTEVKRHTTDIVVSFVEEMVPGTRLQVLCPIFKMENRTWADELNIIMQKGFSRIEFNNNVVKIEDLLAFVQAGKSDNEEFKGIGKKAGKLMEEAMLLVDRLSVDPGDDDNRSRLADSVQTAFYEGHGTCIIEAFTDEKPTRYTFSDKFELDGITFEEPSVNLFTFNNPYGACKSCEGFGQVIGIDEEKVIPDKNLSVYEEGVAAWRGEKMSEWKDDFVKAARKYDFPIHRSYSELNEKEKQLLWRGNKDISGILDFFKYVESKTYKIQYRVMLARYKGKTKCMECGGSRLRPEASYVKINSISINELVDLPAKKLYEFFKNLELSPKDAQVAKRILLEINNRLEFLNDVGLGYLTLNRTSRTLSGGESQRIQIVTSLGSNLTGALYILDEPSIGLHSRDTDKLLRVLKRLKSLGNTVIVVEHDEDIIREADEVIDIGPHAGSLGGELVFQGDLQQLMSVGQSLTAKYMREELKVPVPSKRRSWTHKIDIIGADKNNLKNINVTLPLNVMTVISGVSGSGKSTLVKEVIYPLLKDVVEKKSTKNLAKTEGDYKKIKRIEYVDQDPIGKSSRSNPVTYLKAFDPIRELFSKQPLAKSRGFTPAYFSFNVEGGRCEVCKGEGNITIEMQFMADVEVICENCNGARYKADLLEVTYKEKNISDVLNMTVHDAIEYFAEHKEIVNAIMPLSKVGLDYLTLGQPSPHLSGGEAQRVKLATFLVKTNAPDPIMFIFDEPTTGLHFNDIHVLLESFQLLVENGHTVLIIEHNMDVIKCADWLIDLGPEGGEAGGNLLFQGLPEDILDVEESYTGKYLREKFR
ncbi:MAG: excinuclease ABC subunit A [Sphingobacteriales bacterium]|nr:MAG: excinuclease ABC subunit A [Sphingobacteriales bacterium]